MVAGNSLWQAAIQLEEFIFCADQGRVAYTIAQIALLLVLSEAQDCPSV